MTLLRKAKVAGAVEIKKQRREIKRSEVGWNFSEWLGKAKVILCEWESGSPENIYQRQRENQVKGS